jgi:hypothetical protein
MNRSTRLLTTLSKSSPILHTPAFRPSFRPLARSATNLGLGLNRIPLSLSLSRRCYSVQNPNVTNPTSIPTQQSSTSTSSSSSSGPNGSTPEPEPTSAYARFKVLAKKYGWYAFGMYWILSTIDFTLSYAVVHGVGAERIEPLLASSLRQFRLWRHGEEETAQLEAEDVKRRAEVKKETEGKGAKYWGSRMMWAEIAIAYTIHKTLLLPFRAGLTAAWTPKVVKWLRARGWAGKVSFSSNGMWVIADEIGRDI